MNNDINTYHEKHKLDHEEICDKLAFIINVENLVANKSNFTHPYCLVLNGNLIGDCSKKTTATLMFWT